MANKNKGKVIQMLSPENYIRKKSRSLPIHECWINADWQDSGMTSIIVSRRHTNGNITFCLYLVDLLCLGVKDTSYKFNITETEFRNFIERMEGRMEMEMVEYVLVHNIILSATEFAEEYGFKPHKDFTSVTEYLLEEDTDDIELMEIECGRNGKPLYMQGPFDDESKANKILKQLEHTAGKGNFDFVQEIGSDFEDDWDGEIENLYDDMTFDEKEVKFKQYYDRIAKLTYEEYEDFIDLLQSIVDDLVDADAYFQFCDELSDEFDSFKITHDKIPNEMLGLESDFPPISNEIKQNFLSIIREGSLKQKQKQFKIFSKNKGVEAAVDYLDVLIAGLEHSEKYEKKLNEAATKHPNYPILKLKWIKNSTTLSEELKSIPHYPCKMDNFFKGRDSIHPWEFFCYLDMYTHLVILEKDFAKLDALKTIIDETDIDEDSITALTAIINIFQTEIVAGYFWEKNNEKT